MNTRITITAFSLFISIVALTLSFYSFHINQKQSIKPVMIFTNEKNTDTKEPKPADFWYVTNVGQGAAINVLLLEGNGRTWNEKRVIGIPAFPKGYTHRLSWSESNIQFCAVYKDIVGRTYTTTVGNNENKIHEGKIKEIPEKLTATIYVWDANNKIQAFH